jgi:hypothetical protein
MSITNLSSSSFPINRISSVKVSATLSPVYMAITDEHLAHLRPLLQHPMFSQSTAQPASNIQSPQSRLTLTVTVPSVTFTLLNRLTICLLHQTFDHTRCVSEQFVFIRDQVTPP